MKKDVITNFKNYVIAFMLHIVENLVVLKVVIAKIANASTAITPT